MIAMNSTAKALLESRTMQRYLITYEYGQIRKTEVVRAVSIDKAVAKIRANNLQSESQNFPIIVTYVFKE